MSQINDALKRAQQHTGGSSVNPPPALPAPPEPGSRKGLLLVIIILLVAGAGLLMGLALVRPPAKTVPPPVAAPPPSPVIPKLETVVAPMPLSNPPAPQVLAIDTSNSLPKLQGILYDPVYPEAIVNGKTLRVGRTIGNYRVKAITKFAVTLIDATGAETNIHMEK